MQKTALSHPAQFPKWLDPRQPVLFILRFTLAYAVIVTIGTTLIAYFIKGRHNAIAPSELSLAFLGDCTAGVIIALFTLWRVRRRLPAESN